MNNLSINLQSNTIEPAPVLKLIVFGIGNLNLALPIESVYKVINRTPVYGSGLRSVGVAHVDDGQVTVVDLYRRFFQSSQTSESDSGGYLVIVKNTTGELYGIPVTDTPTLIEVPSSTIRVLPDSYRHSDTLEVASHVTVIPQEAESLTVFLLDVARLLPLFQQIKAAQS